MCKIKPDGGTFMSLPTIPNITPKISLNRCETINMLLSSIALEEIGLSHILNAEGEKLQCFLETDPCELNDYLKINDSINKTLRTIVKSQILLQFKLEDIISLSEDSCCNHCGDHKKEKSCDCCEEHTHKKEELFVFCQTCKKKNPCTCGQKNAKRTIR